MLTADLLPGGRADRMAPDMFDPVQLARGTRVELEHTRDLAIAREIAMDHLVEDPDYYRKLAAVHLDGDSSTSALSIVGIIAAFAAAYMGMIFIMTRDRDPLEAPRRSRGARRQPFTG